MEPPVALAIHFATLRLCVKIILIVAVFIDPKLLFAGGSSEAESLRRACEYLWSQQADDGGWHSEQYAVLRSGQALTPFVLHTLLQTIDGLSVEDAQRVSRALDFIRVNVDEAGCLGTADPDVLEYPVYSTAYAVLCLKRAQNYPPLFRLDNYDLIMRMEEYLASAQFDEADGFKREDAAYGGWGFDAAHRPGQSGHMDLAHTRRALTALRAPAGGVSRGHYRQSSELDRLSERTVKFLMLVQKHPQVELDAPFDGGFYFSPVVLAANKGREVESDGAMHFRSYATATCDGILALLAAGVPSDDPRIVRAADWLRRHDDLAYPQGVPKEHPEPWGEAIRFYHYAVRAEAYSVLNWPGDWKSRLAAEIARHQDAEGSFRNRVSPLMKEDDSLLCTALATIALDALQEQVSESANGS